MVFNSIRLYNLSNSVFNTICKDVETNTILLRTPLFIDYFYIGETTYIQPFGRDGKPIDPSYKKYGIFRETLPFIEGYNLRKNNTPFEYVKMFLDMNSIQEIYNLREGKAEETLAEFVTKNICHIDKLYSDFITKNVKWT